MATDFTPKQLNELGDRYFYGNGQAQNIELAYTYYKQAADMDNPVGYYNIGNYYLLKKDIKSALVHYEKAKAFLYSPASIAIAELYKTGMLVRKNKKKAFKYFLDAAKLNDPDAFNAVGDCYENGIGCKKNAEQSYHYYQKSADLNNKIGQYHVGLYLMNQSEAKKNPEKALHWLDKAAEQGLKEALRYLQNFYQEAKHPYLSKKSVSHCQEMAFHYTELLAKEKDVPSLKLASTAYYEGMGPARKNYEKAAYYYQLLKDLNEPDGFYGYGVCLLLGQGLKQNIEEAKTYLDLAANHQHPQALTKLGDLYRMGMKSGVDVDKAKHYYMEASRLGDLDALVNLGLMNYKDQLPNASLSLAYSYMETAAKKGSYQAMYWLGIFHQKGVSVIASFKEAEKWFEKAIKAGSLGAKYKLATLIIEDMNKEPIKPKKKSVYYARAKTLLVEYALDLQHNTNNYAMGMYYLGYLYQTGLGVTKSDRTARYWFEMAAQIGLSKAMVEIYRYLKDSEPTQAFRRLQEALQDKTCSDAMYEMGLLCMTGYLDYVKEDINQAKKWFESASRLNHPQALEKLMMT